MFGWTFFQQRSVDIYFPPASCAISKTTQNQKTLFIPKGQLTNNQAAYIEESAMAALISFSLWWIWLSVSVLRSAASESKRGTEITAEFGQENITLTCRAPNNNNIMIVEWSRADLGNEYVLLYRNGHFDPDHQHPSFKNRVDLQDRQMKDGDVSLILKKVTTDDKGTYECRVFKRGTKRRKRANLNTDPISIISLKVVDPPGQTGGLTEDGGKEDGGKEDGGEKSGSVGLIAGLVVTAVLLVAAVSGFLIYRKHKKLNQDSYQPPVEMYHV